MGKMGQENRDNPDNPHFSFTSPPRPFEPPDYGFAVQGGSASRPALVHLPPTHGHRPLGSLRKSLTGEGKRAYN